MITGSKRLTSNLLVCLLSFLFVLSGCGGGGGGDELVPPNQPGGEASSVLGVVVDPYIVDAVIQEIDPKGKVLQESTPSDAKGQFSFANALSDDSLVKMKASAQIRHNNAPYSGILKSRPAGQQPLVVSPLTTLIANGMTAEQVVNLLQDAGLKGFIPHDVFADPMEGTDDVTGIGHLERLQASLAVNAFFALNENYEMDRSAVADQKAKLEELVQAVRTVVDPEIFQQAESAPQLSTLATGTPRVNFGHFLKAAVAITDAVVAKKRADLDLNAIDEAGLLLGSLPDLALFYYAQENRGVEIIEDRIKDGILPDASPGAVPAIEASGKVVKNTPPVASAGSGKTVSVTEVVQLNAGASSDADGDALSYRWAISSKPEGSQAVLNNDASPTPTFIADQAGAYELTLVVNDGNVNSAPSNIVINAVEENDPAPVQEPAYEAPVLGPVEVNGTSWILQWSQPGDVPEGGYDIVIDGQNTGTANRTSQMSINLSGLPAGVQHCFQIEARYTQAELDVFQTSNQVCAKPEASIESPVEESPVEESPVEESPIEESPIEESPIEESPIEESPVEESPIVYPPYDGGPLPVFPGAQGFGATTKAGRGGKIIKVTNLNDSGSGSLRAAIDTSGPRIIVFEISGEIHLSSDLNISDPYVTIAGQTAPSPGITLRGAGIRINTHDVLLQHLRIRVGDGPGGPSPINRDALQILYSSYNVVVDHISASWAVDETGSTWGEVRDVTISNSIFSEGLHRSIHPKGAHSKGFLIGDRGRRIAFIGNLTAHADERLPRVKGDVTTMVVNNVSYNTGGSNSMVIGAPEGPALVSVVGNVFINGTNTSTPSRAIAVAGTSAPGTKIYVKDNIASDEVFQGSSSWVVSTPPIWSSDVQVIPTNLVEDYVLSNGGSRPSDRDSVDLRIVEEVRTRTGHIIDSQDQVGGWPILQKNIRAFDIPENPHGVTSTGYTRIEEVLHRMAAAVEH